MLRHRGSLTVGQVGDVIDYVCSVASHHRVFFLWRPLLRDPNDDMVAEVGVASGARAIVTFNERDFRGVEKFGVKVWSPRHLLEGIKK